MGKEAIDYLISLHPLGRLAQPEEIAHAVIFPIENEFTTGLSLVVSRQTDKEASCAKTVCSLRRRRLTVENAFRSIVLEEPAQIRVDVIPTLIPERRSVKH